MSLSAKRPSKLKDRLMQEVKDDAHGPKKRLNTNVEANLYRRIKKQAVLEERSISDITRQLWIEYLSKNSSE